MKAEFLLKHIAIGEFVKVVLRGGSAYGELLGADDTALAVRWPEKDGGSVQVIPMGEVENITNGAIAMGCYEDASKRDRPDLSDAIARAFEQMSNAAEHAD